jgi:fido (protein-threonine AMPylation protein)
MIGFDGFRDSLEAPFYRAGASSPGETWAEAARRVNLVIESATAAARHRSVEMTVEHICRWHRGIFLTTFKSDAGRVREDYEHARFGIPIEIDGELIRSAMRGVLPKSAILTRLHAACETFNARRASLERGGQAPSAVEGVAPAADLYAEILEIHPFVDGNLRAAYVALQVGLVSLGLPTVRFGRVIARHDECLGLAIRQDAERTSAPLTELIVKLMDDDSPAASGATLRKMTIRYRDLDLPPGRCIADGTGIRAWDESSSKELAFDAMILSQGAKRAQEMQDAQDAAEAKTKAIAAST